MQSSPYSRVKDELSRALEKAAKAAGFDPKSIDDTVEFSQGFGDISCSVSFRIAKGRPGTPNDIAQSIVDKLAAPDFVKKTAVQNGYINFYLHRVWYIKQTMDYAFSIKRAEPVSGMGKNEKVIIEYPSVNPNKPWHLGHLKNAVLGDTVANIHQACGYNVEREDFIEDLGSQVVESVWGFLNLNKEPGEKKFDHWLGEEYVKVNQEMEKRDIKQELSKLLQLMEQDGTYESKLARDLSERCVRAQNQTAFSYLIFRDVLIWETDIVATKQLEAALELLLKKGVAKKMTEGEHANCIVMDLSAVKNLPSEFRGLKEMIKVLIRNDGTPTYVAKDIAFHMWKFGLLDNRFRFIPFVERQPNGKPLFTTSKSGKGIDYGNVKKAVNIIDARQDYPQALVRLAFTLLGRYDIADGIKHLSYGALELESGSLSGRSGNWIGNTADDLLAEAEKKAFSLINEAKAKLSAQEKEEVARAVALGAIKFDLLRLSPERKTIFSWERALGFKGNSGPYCQYMYARAVRLIEDSKMGGEISYDPEAVTTDYEFNLIKLMSRFTDTVEKSCAELRPNVMTEYANNLAAAFSNMYESVPILKSMDERQRQGRLAIALAFANIIKYSLSILGIPSVNMM